MDNSVTQAIPPAVQQLVDRLQKANGDASTVSANLEDDSTQVFNILIFGKKQELSALGSCHWYGVQLVELTAKRSGEIVRTYIQVTLNSMTAQPGVRNDMEASSLLVS